LSSIFGNVGKYFSIISRKYSGFAECLVVSVITTDSGCVPGVGAGEFGSPFFVVVSRYWNGVSKVPRDLPPMPGIRTALLLCGLGVAVALTVAWDSFLSYEFYRFAEFIF
jgi:hypothetical protein